MTVVVTGAAGFIGFHLSRRLVKEGRAVLGVDALKPGYERSLCLDRLSNLQALADFEFVEADICDPVTMLSLVRRSDADVIVHLAAQPGVRQSMNLPLSCLRTNVEGTGSILEAARQVHVEPLPVIYASSSSVYGVGTGLPSLEDARVDRPISVYGASKSAAELVASAYASVYGMCLVGLRFFTVYGPWGRPDMAPMLFARAIQAGRPVRLFDDGRPRRDFTFVDDIVDGIIGALRCVETKDLGPGNHLYNLGGASSEPVSALLQCLAKHIGRDPVIQSEPLPTTDIPFTLADITRARRDLGFFPRTSLDLGTSELVNWLRTYDRWE